MRKQVWVAPNGRSEVRVMLVRKTEVTAVGWCVNRLWQRAQHHGVKRRRINPVARFFDEVRVIRGFRAITATERQPAQREGLSERSKFRWQRNIVHSVEQRLLCGVQKFGGADVCREHHFFDELVRVVANCGLDACNAAVIVETENCLLPFKI